MILEEQITTPNLSTKLEPYIKSHDTLYRWWPPVFGGYWGLLRSPKKHAPQESIAAMTAEECLEILPRVIIQGDMELYLDADLSDPVKEAYYDDGERVPKSAYPRGRGPTLTEALGNLLLVCYERNLIPKEEK